MPQNHHRDVLRPLKAVKLVVVLLTQFDKALTITEHPNIYYMYVLAPVVSRISRRVRVSPRTAHANERTRGERTLARLFCFLTMMCPLIPWPYPPLPPFQVSSLSSHRRSTAGRQWTPHCCKNVGQESCFGGESSPRSMMGLPLLPPQRHW